MWSTCSHFSIRSRILPSHAQSLARSATGETRSAKWTWTTWPEAAPPGRRPQSLASKQGKVTGTSAGQRTLGYPPSHRCGTRLADSQAAAGTVRTGAGVAVLLPCWAQGCSSEAWGERSSDLRVRPGCLSLVLFVHTLLSVPLIG